MPKIKFPVVKGKHVVFPRKPLCPWCNQRKVYEPHSMAILNAGALQRTGKHSYSMATEADAFFTLTWHGAHRQSGGQGIDPDIFADLQIADLVASGQFDLYFCSTQCLRSFLNYCVDELEREVERAKRSEQRQRKARKKIQG